VRKKERGEKRKGRKRGKEKGEKMEKFPNMKLLGEKIKDNLWT
jgi:hypothetical protein